MKAASDEDTFDAMQGELITSARGRARQNLPNPSKPGETTSVTVTDINGPLANREEEMFSRVASKIPGIGASERNFITTLNWLRAEMFDHFDGTYAARWRAGDMTDVEYHQARHDLAEFVNVATGRGDLPGFLGNHLATTAVLNGLFFSPRLFMSRLRIAQMALPGQTLSRTSPEIRRLARESLAAYVAEGSAILGIGVLGGIWSVEHDPTSTDFGQVRIGPNRTDIWGGFRPIVNLMARSATGQIKTTDGNFRDVSYPELIARFGVNKGAPVPSTLLSLLIGENPIGESRTLTGGLPAAQGIPFLENIPAPVFDLLGPLSVMDIFEGAREDGIRGAALGGFGLIGAGVSSFRTNTDVKNDVTRNFGFGDTFADIDPTDVDKIQAVRRHPDVVNKQIERGGEASIVAEASYQSQLDIDQKILASFDPDQLGGYQSDDPWREWKADRSELRTADNAVFDRIFDSDRTQPPVSNPKDSWDVFRNIIWRYTDPSTGETDWDQVDAFVATLPDTEQELIMARGQWNDTPLGLARSVVTFQVRKFGGFDISDDAFTEAAIGGGLPKLQWYEGIARYRGRLFREFLAQGLSADAARTEVGRDPVVVDYNRLNSSRRDKWAIANPELALRAAAMGIWRTSIEQRDFLDAFSAQQEDGSFNEQEFIGQSAPATQQQRAAAPVLP